MSFKKRIATHFMLATALVIAAVFGVVYFIVQQTVYQNLDNDLAYEANKHARVIAVTDSSIYFTNKTEWEQSEHREIQVNPVFLQLIDNSGRVMDKSPNLKEKQLVLNAKNASSEHFTTKLNRDYVRQAQIPIKKNGKVKGYILAAMSLESSLMVLENLRNVLFISYPIVLIALFFISSFLAGRSIVPVVSIINTTNRITKNNLNERVALPQNDDELYALSSSINSLLERIENAIEREKQFTSDASHELRTPLSVLRGTLEVLIRKERTPEEYVDKIKYSLTEIDRMATTIEQLLEVARYESDAALNSDTVISLHSLIDQILTENRTVLNAKKNSITLKNTVSGTVLVNGAHSKLILDNVISNAIKYSHPNSAILLELQTTPKGISVRVEDSGIGIKEEDLSKIFTPFFRSAALDHKAIKGVGLGLSIAQKAATAIDAQISVESKFGQGTKVTVLFKEILKEK